MMKCRIGLLHDDQCKRHDADDTSRCRSEALPPTAAVAVDGVGSVGVGQGHCAGDFGHDVGAAVVDLGPCLG